MAMTTATAMFSLRSNHRVFSRRLTAMFPFRSNHRVFSRRLLPSSSCSPRFLHYRVRNPPRKGAIATRVKLDGSEAGGKGVVSDEEEGARDLKGLVVVDETKDSEDDQGLSLLLNWKNLPARYKIIATTSLAFVICNMDKVNLSIAIIPMSHQFGWNSSTAGLVQSSFFWGYALSQLPGGWLSKLFGGSKVLKFGVLAWSIATMLVPFVAGFMPGLVLSRILVGIGEGVSPSAATDLIARSIPLQERSRAVAVVFGGLSIGSVLGLLFAPPIIESFGWESVFYTFGILGIIWCLVFEFVKDGKFSLAGDYVDSRQRVASIRSPLMTSDPQRTSSNISFRDLTDSLKDVPWMAFFKSPAVWAMIYAHFCGSWGHYTCLSWIPTYFSEELDLNLTEAAWVSILPSLGSILVSSIAAPFADNLISTGVEPTTVR